MDRAKRGDLAVIERTHHDYVIGTGPTERTEYIVGRVASITREGVMKAADVPSYRGSTFRDAVRLGDRVYVQSADTLDVDAAVEIARAHTWPGHPESPMPYSSLDELRAALQSARCCPHHATSADECSMIRERSVAGVSDQVPDCPLHGPYRGAE